MGAVEKKTLKRAAAFAFLILLLLGLMGANLCLGSVPLSAGQILEALAEPGSGERAARILWNIRIPRMLAAAILGGALAVSGFLLQTFFGNPIAGPFVLGISSGAKLTIALTMIFLLEQGILIPAWGMVAAAFAGAMLSMLVILSISAKTGRMSVLVVCGVMIGYICSAVTDFAVTFAADSNIVNLHNWSLGSFAGTDWGDIAFLLPLVLLGLAASVLISKPMDAYRLGEQYAASLGVDIRRFRIELILLASVLAACVTAFAGPVSFVGIAVPHLMKQFFRTGRPILMIPACFLGGAVFCLGCDLIARSVFAPTELSISTVTAVFGAPVVIWMMLHRERENGS